MTAFLRLNGIVVPAAMGSPVLSQDDLGGESRADDGTPLFSRRQRKRKWAVRTRLGTAAEQLAFRDLVWGTGHVLSWEGDHHYTSKGLAPTAVGANVSISGTNPKYGAKRLLSGATTDNKVTWPMFSASSPWTVALWVSTSDFLPWVHYVVNSAAHKWVDGIRNDSATTDFLAVSSGAVTLGKTSTGLAFDDVVGIPNIVPADWPAQIAGFGYAFGTLIELTADGLFIEQNARVTVKGVVGEMKVVRIKGDYIHDLAFTLLES